MTSLDWGHYSPGSDDAFPTPFKMEPIVVIVLFPFVIAAFVLFFETAVDAAADFAFAFGLAFAFPKPTATLASPLTITSMFPSALINRGATPPIKLITKPSTTVAFAKLAKPLFYCAETQRVVTQADQRPRRPDHRSVQDEEPPGWL